MRLWRLGLLTAAAACGAALVPVGPAAAGAGAGDVPMRGQDERNSGWNQHESQVTPDRVGELTAGWSRAMDRQGGVLVVGTTVLAACHIDLCALHAASGRLLWRSPSFVARAVVGDTVYGGYGGPGSGRNGSIAAVELATGRLRWHVPVPDAEPYYQDLTASSSLGLVLVSMPSGWLHAYDGATGALRWRSFGAWAAPAVAEGVVYTALPSNDRLYAFDGRTGRLLWQGGHHTLDVSGRPTVANGLVYVVSSPSADAYPSVAAFDADGCGAALCEPVWTTALGGRGPFGITVEGERGFAVAWGGLTSASPPGTLYAFDARTGEVLWSAPEAKAFGVPIVAGGVVWASTFTGELVAYRSAGCGQAACSALRRFAVGSADQNHFEPTVAHGVVYHVHNNRLRTFTLPGRWPAPAGYWMLGSPGTVFGFGDVESHPPAPVPAGASAVDMDGISSGRGYWVADDAGHVFAFGDAPYLGGVTPPPGDRVVSIAGTPNDDGYWVFTAQGRVYPFGAATHLGDMAGTPLNGPVLDTIVTPSGRGYYMVGSDGGVFAFGDARFRGSMGGKPLNQPVRSLAPDPDGVGYWLVAYDGGVFAFDAPFRGSMGGKPLNKPVIGMSGFGNGYLLVGADGGIFNFSDKPFLGSLGVNPPPYPIVSVAAL